MHSDSDLLQLFCDSGDEAAFTMLVERHAGMVRAVIWRRTQDWSLVEEAAWKVFAVLARKAKSLRSVPLAGWLHRAAMHEAGNAARKAGRYRRTLRDYHLHETMSEPPTGNATWEEIQPHLDAALARLPAAARELVLMHYLEQRGISEIASATGTNVEACRKRIRRSLDLLEDTLRRRGLVVSGTALAALFTAHSAGVSHAAAVSLTAAALKAAPSLTASSLVLHSLHVMNHTTLTKITVVALVLAAVPVTLLWQQNDKLQETVKELQAHRSLPAERKTPRPVVALPVPPRPATPAGETGSGKAVADGAESFHAAMTQKAQAKAKKQAAQEFTRICLNLPDLTDDQKARIQPMLEAKFLEQIQEVLTVFQSGAVARAAQSTGELTAGEKEAIAKLDPRGMKPPAVEGEMQAILTPDQFGEYAVRKEQKRIGDAEDGATDTLKSLGKKFDLTPQQKDVIFQQLAAHDLDPRKEDRVSAGNPFPRIGSRDETRDRIIRSQLTPPQAEIFDRDRAVEKEALQKQMMEYYTERASAGK